MRTTRMAAAAGTLRQLHAVLRHGDRSPVFSASEGCPPAAAAEAAAWAARAHPGGDGAEAAAAAAAAGLDRRFPVRAAVPPLCEAARGGGSPYGALTTLGAAQARHRGLQLRHTYAELLQRQQRLRMKGSVRAVASNFLRTQLCAQQVLAGLLLPDGGGGEDDGDDVLVPVVVPPPADCNVAVFEAGRGLAPLQRRIYTSPAYAAEEARLAAVAAAFVSTVPHFRGGGRWMWIRAADLLTTYAAHGFGLPARLRVHERACADHLAWRFRTFFSYAAPLSLAAGGLLVDVATTMVATAAGDGTSAATPTPPPDVSVYSGHDVTLLPLLVALAAAVPGRHLPAGAPLLTVTRAGGGPEEAVHDPSAAALSVPWPAYASMLALELHELGGGDAAREGGGGGSVPPLQPGELPSALKLPPSVDASRWWVHWRLHNERVQPSAAEAAATLQPASSHDWYRHWLSDDPKGTATTAAAAPVAAAADDVAGDAVIGLRGRLPLAGFLRLVGDVAAGRVGAADLPGTEGEGGHV